MKLVKSVVFSCHPRASGDSGLSHTATCILDSRFRGNDNPTICRLLKKITIVILSLSIIAAAPDPNTELAYKAQFGRADDIAILVQQGASADAKNEQGIPAISAAALRGGNDGIAMMKALLDAGANINAVDTEGRTALHRAAAVGKLESVTFLIEHGADTYIQDKFGNYAAGLAYQGDYKESYQYITDSVEKARQERLEGYKKYNESVQEQYDKIKQRLDEYNEKQKTQKELNAMNAQERKMQLEKEEAERKRLEEELEKKRQEREAEENRIKAIEASYHSEPFYHSVRDLAQKACSFQYWAYCKKVRVKTDYSPEQLENIISAQAQAIEAKKKALKEEYLLDDTYMNTIITPSQQEITRNLKSYGSNATLSSNGVGTKADAEQRCRELAENLSFGGISYYEEPEEDTQKSSSMQGGMQPANNSPAASINQQQPNALPVTSPKQPKMRKPKAPRMMQNKGQ